MIIVVGILNAVLDVMAMALFVERLDPVLNIYKIAQRKTDLLDIEKTDSI